MITIIPSFGILKSVCDNNISGSASQIREKAFSVATELQSKADVDVLIDGSIFERIKNKLERSHITFFEKTYRIDDSVTGLLSYDHTASVKWVASSESKARRVIILTDNITDFSFILSSRISAVTPTEFIEKVEKAEKDVLTRKFSSIEDSIMAIFFRI